MNCHQTSFALRLAQEVNATWEEKKKKKNQQNIHFHQENTKPLFHQKENKIIVSATRLSYKQNEKVIIKAKYSNNYNRLVFIHGGRKKK